MMTESLEMGKRWAHLKKCLIALLIVLLFVIIIVVLKKSRSVVPVAGFTCRECESTILCKSEKPLLSKSKVLYKSPFFESCVHEWKKGIDRTHPCIIRNNTLILLKKGKAFGVFAFDEQKKSPERAVYRWWYREDGKGKFGIKDTAILNGTNSCNLTENPGDIIAFGPFKLQWSCRSTGLGYIYYNHFSSNHASEASLYICVTDLNELKGLDASDSTWDYRASRVACYLYNTPITGRTVSSHIGVNKTNTGEYHPTKATAIESRREFIEKQIHQMGTNYLSIRVIADPEKKNGIAVRGELSSRKEIRMLFNNLSNFISEEEMNQVQISLQDPSPQPKEDEAANRED